MPVYTYTTIDVPLADTKFGSAAYGINDAGQIVGWYYDSNVVYHGFLLSVCVYTTFNDSLAIRGTGRYGINALGQIVGSYAADLGDHGFLLSGGTYTTLDDPSAISTVPRAVSNTVARGINDAGQIVGYYSV